MRKTPIGPRSFEEALAKRKLSQSKARKKVKKKKSKSKSWYKERLDKYFSKFIRKRDSHKCCTCGKQLEENESQNGHYIPRGHMNTRWDEENCHCQCVGCNVFKKGNMDEYAIFMVKTYGEEMLGEMQKRKNTIKQWTVDELKVLIEKYKNLISL